MIFDSEQLVLLNFNFFIFFMCVAITIRVYILKDQI